MICATPDTVTLHVPFRIPHRGGRKEMQLPPGAPALSTKDDSLVKALARAFRWKRMLESGAFTTLTELADHEGLGRSYLTRILNLTLLAPDIVEAILDGTQGSNVTLARMMEGVPVAWEEQVSQFR